MRLYLAQRLADQFGGKRAALNAFWYQTQLHLGRFHSYQNFDLAFTQRLVFVCHGNICRSPYAQRLAQAHGFQSFSFGLNADPGKTANPMAQQIAGEHGISLATHQATHIRDYVPTDGDLVLGFEPVHSQILERMLEQPGVVISLLGLWHKPPFAYIHDPYGLNADYFRICFQRIEEAVLDLLRRLAVMTMEKTS